jgi:hypothetical protein
VADQLVAPAELASFLQLDYAALSDLQKANMTLLVELATGKVQAAAGQLLIEGIATVSIDVDMCDFDPWLPLPQLPVRSVATVLIDGVGDTSWRLRKQMLWRLNGWSTNGSAPTEVIPTFTYGYPAGAQKLQLALAFTFALAGLGYGNPAAVAAESLDDYRVEYADAEARMVVSAGMREQLVNAYGTSAYVTRSRN